MYLSVLQVQISNEVTGCPHRENVAEEIYLYCPIKNKDWLNQVGKMKWNEHTYLAGDFLKFLANLHLQSLSRRDLAFDNHGILQENPEEVAAYSMDFQNEMKVEQCFDQCLGDWHWDLVQHGLISHYRDLPKFVSDCKQSKWDWTTLQKPKYHKCIVEITVLHGKDFQVQSLVDGCECDKHSTKFE